MPDVLIGAIGGVIVLLVASDIFRSLLVPRASTRWLRVAPLITLALFSGWQALASRIPDRDFRQTVRASLAPLMLVLLLVIWATFLILGFGLIFWADRANFAPRFVDLSDAIYAAGSAFSTLGINGKVSGDLTRIAVLICSVTGLAIVTVVATFLISLQSGFGRREALVLRLEAHVTLPPAGIAILETYAREGVIERLGMFFETWELWAAEVAISHRAFPILVFFRSNDSRCEWLTALGAVLDAAALLDSAVENTPAPARAGAHFMLRTGSRLLCDVAHQFKVTPPPGFDVANADRFQDHRRRLADAGYDVVSDGEAAFRAFSERRRGYASSLTALARQLHIHVDERGANQNDSTPIA